MPEASSSGGLIGDLSSAANQLGVGQAIDLLKGVVMPGITQAIQNAGSAAVAARWQPHRQWRPRARLPPSADAIQALGSHARTEPWAAPPGNSAPRVQSRVRVENSFFTIDSPVRVAS